MAEVLKGYTFPEQRTRRTYDWEEILDGSIRKLEPGVDFGGNPRGFLARIRTVARQRDLNVNVDLTDDGAIVVQATAGPAVV